MGGLSYGSARPAVAQADLATVARYMFWLMLPVPADYRAPYDPNIDIVQAAVYSAEPVTGPRLLATAAALRAQWADPGSKYFYPVNGADAAQGLGPLLGRYPGDVYDGDTDQQAGDHPWALTTANFAELYYRVAAKNRFIPNGCG